MSSGAATQPTCTSTVCGGSSTARGPRCGFVTNHVSISAIPVNGNHPQEKYRLHMLKVLKELKVGFAAGHECHVGCYRGSCRSLEWSPTQRMWRVLPTWHLGVQDRASARTTFMRLAISQRDCSRCCRRWEPQWWCCVRDARVLHACGHAA